MAFTTTYCFMRGKAPPLLPWTYMMTGQINQSPRYSPALNVIFCQTNTWTTPLLLNNVTKHFRHFVKRCSVKHLLRLLFVRPRYQSSGLGQQYNKSKYSKYWKALSQPHCYFFKLSIVIKSIIIQKVNKIS